MKRLSVILAVCIAAAAWAGDCVPALGEGFGTDLVRVWGSRSVASRIDLYAKEFMSMYPGKTIVVVGSKTERGVEQFVKGHAEVLMMSRPLSEDETGQAQKSGLKVQENQVGVGAVALVVNPANPVKDLTIEQASNIFQGLIKNWRDVGGEDAAVQVIAIDATDSDTREFVKEKLLGGKAIVSTAITRPVYKAVLKQVAQIKNAIGFARASDIYYLQRSGRKGSVKVLGLRIREGTQVFYPITTVAAGHSRTYYPLERPYFLYHNAAATGELARAFGKFCEERIITNPGDYLDRQY